MSKSSASESLTYKDAGVDIDAGSELVRRIAKWHRISVASEDFFHSVYSFLIIVDSSLITFFIFLFFFYACVFEL